jgi:hypothetical protein
MHIAPGSHGDRAAAGNADGSGELGNLTAGLLDRGQARFGILQQLFPGRAWFGHHRSPDVWSVARSPVTLRRANTDWQQIRRTGG